MNLSTGTPLTVYRRLSRDGPPRAADQSGPDTCSYCSEDWWQRYNAFLFTLTKRMSQNWQAVGSITISKTEGLHSASSLSTASSQSSAASTFGDDPNELTNAAGLLPGDRGVMFKLQGSYAFPYDIVVSSNWQSVSGKAYTRRLSAGNLPQGTQTVFLQPRDGRCGCRRRILVDMGFEKGSGGGTSKSPDGRRPQRLTSTRPLSWISEVAPPDFAVAISRHPTPLRCSRCVTSSDDNCGVSQSRPAFF